MATVSCVDGAVLDVRPVAVLDREDVPYEVTLALTLDGSPFAEVGERCGWFLSQACDRLASAGGGLPRSSVESGVRAWASAAGQDGDDVWPALARRLPRDRELFCFRARDPDDLATAGELRVRLDAERTLRAGRWQVRPRAVLEAWGDGGRGVRAVLDLAALGALLGALLTECDAVAPGRAT